ncbi:MAG: hypothetical protein K2J63_10890 [Muribaculaceae bacterium]|nr:hypothetical protein [Muribaculaceae bacterium]
MESFEDILGKGLQACEGLDDSQIEEALNKLMKEEGFNEEEKGFVGETFELLDASAEKYEDLQRAKEDGVGRQEWLAKQFDKMLEGRSEEEVDTVMKAIEKGTNIVVDEEFKAAEVMANEDEQSEKSDKVSEVEESAKTVEEDINKSTK